MMLGWFAGPSKVTEEHTSPNDYDSYAEDAPDTPAPQFAIRALKSAFLGTPHAKQSAKRGPRGNNSKEDVTYEKAELQPGNKEEQSSPPGKLRRLRNDPLLSPTKGILLTPGTAVNKRKTVSFGDFGVGAKGRVDLFTGQTIALASKAEPAAVPTAAADNTKDKEAQAVHIKSAFESQPKGSKRRIGTQAQIQEGGVVAKPPQGRETTAANLASQPIIREPVRDITVDLNVPCSRSGKHWKGEYDQFHRKSNREVRRLIQHGQTIKSYAQKKDSEASSLHQKLDKELAKVASMEAKVSELATELANVRSRGAQRDVDSSQLVTDLAKQTATAIRSKQKAERYKAALKVHDEAEGSLGYNDECVQITLPDALKPPEGQIDFEKMATLQTELGNLRSAFHIAEGKAVKLQNENMALKNNMARVKSEMQSYEQRRLAREERLAKKHAKLMAAKEASEAKYEQLKVEHEQLRRTHATRADKRRDEEVFSTQVGKSIQKDDYEVAILQQQQTTPANSSTVPAQQDLPSTLEERHAALTSKRKSIESRERPKSTLRRPRSPLVQHGKAPSEPSYHHDGKATEPNRQTSPAPRDSSPDIWIHNASSDLVDDTLPTPETPQGSDFTQLRRSTYAALQEISQNSISEQQAVGQMPSPQLETATKTPAVAPTIPQKLAPSSAARRMHSRRSTIASPRPSFLSMASSAQKSDMHRVRPDSSLVSLDRRPTLLSTGTRVSTIGARRPLPPERAEAARKRLEAKREEKRAKEGSALASGV